MSRDVLAFPKPVREVDKDYLRYIRRQGCLLHSQIAAEAHHVKTRAAGGSDYRTVPLCVKHHWQVTKKGRAWFEIEYGVSFDLEMVRLLIPYISALKEGEELGKR